MWASFLLGLGAGIAATPHCLGMCGGFTLHLAHASKSRSGTLRLILFVLGKCFTYIFLGTLAAALGVVVFANTRLAAAAPAMRVTAGIVTLFIGLLMLGVKLPPVRALQGISDSGLVRSMFGGLLAGNGPLAAFVLGLGVGFLPCPLPLGMLALSAASRNLPQGMALMAGVGLGTAPGLIAVGIFGIGLDRRFARLGMKSAGVIVIAVALVIIGRATGVIHTTSPVNHVVPPCCQEHTQ